MILSLLSSPALVSGSIVVSAKNLVHSILFPIPVFRNTSGLLLLLGLDFFAMIFSVVLIGAIAVSFLVVVMMFHIQIAEIHEEVLCYLPVPVESTPTNLENVEEIFNTPVAISFSDDDLPNGKLSRHIKTLNRTLLIGNHSIYRGQCRLNFIYKAFFALALSLNRSWHCWHISQDYNLPSNPRGLLYCLYLFSFLFRMKQANEVSEKLVCVYRGPPRDINTTIRSIFYCIASSGAKSPFLSDLLRSSVDHLNALFRLFYTIERASCDILPSASTRKTEDPGCCWVSLGAKMGKKDGFLEGPGRVGGRLVLGGSGAEVVVFSFRVQLLKQGNLVHFS
ncbi:hypothetical protein ACH5RR_012730 [Cinchona calisaya]|uniref:Uncharacterized protein n=1 Tax=Cinchona calisaya TaxID=153742 RepID=A0ABD3A8K7_9GENT